MAVPLRPSSTVFAEERKAYFAPPTLGRSFNVIGKTMPADNGGKLAWAVKHLEVGKVDEVLADWPHGAALMDDDGNTLFHLVASQSQRYSAQPEAATQVMQKLLADGWTVVDQKNSKGLRAEVIAQKT